MYQTCRKQLSFSEPIQKCGEWRRYPFNYFYPILPPPLFSQVSLSYDLIDHAYTFHLNRVLYTKDPTFSIHKLTPWLQVPVEKACPDTYNNARVIRN
jgi:hypothetical protein